MSKASSKPRWGDEDDDDEDDDDDDVVMMGDATRRVDSSATAGQIPPTHKSRIDSKGIQIITSYRPNPRNPNGLIKTITKVRVTTEQVREPRGVVIRRKWKKFGQAATETDTSNVTIPSRDEVFLEDPNADTDLQEEDPAKGLAGNLNAFWAKQQRRQLERKYDVIASAVPGEEGGAPGDAAANNNQDASAGGWTQVTGSAGGGGGTGKYVPPAQRAGLGGRDPGGAAGAGGPGGGSGGPGGDRNRTDDLNTIRVTNISENTTEADLQELFQRFGRISRVYLAKDKETMVSRGFAFVSFVHKEEAAVAMEKLQGFGYDHLILKLEWARPSAKDPALSGTEFRSGYGKALAQDTKEKVSFASNLTR